MDSVLYPLQKQILELLFQDPEFAGDFFLSGGCALSWGYLGHRRSEDLDFFSRGEPDLEQLDKKLERILSPHGMELKRLMTGPTFRRYQVSGPTESTLLDLVTQDPAKVAEPHLKGEIRLDSLVDIAVNKVMALEREEIKDSVDLYLLLKEQNFDIFDLMEKAKKKTMNAESPGYPNHVARLLMSAGKLPNFNKLRLLKPVDQKEMIEFLKGQAGLIYEQYR